MQRSIFLFDHPTTKTRNFTLFFRLSSKKAILGPLQKPLLASLFQKTENFSFSVDIILQKCRMIILKLQKDSLESGEHSKYLQSISKVFRNEFQTAFQ